MASAIMTPPGLTATGVTLTREIDGHGTLRFEDYPAGAWVTQKGEPAKKARRRYLLDGDELDATSSIVGTLDKPALLRWYETQSAIGAVQAERMGELSGVDEADYVDRLKELGLGASAKRDEGADRGNAIHAAFHTLAVDGRPPNPAAFAALARPWVRGAVGAWLAMAPQTVSAEEIVCHPELRYGGRPDLIALVDGKLTLIDYKTGKGRVYDSAHYQTRLYAMALPFVGVEVERIIVVGIDDDGGFQLVDCEATEADAVALLHTFRARKRINADMAVQRKIARAAA